MKTAEPLRHENFFYKGIDGHTAQSRLDLLEKAARSPYRWWFETLRCSRDYWWVCVQNGKTLDPDLRRVWTHFGDVFGLGFEAWWLTTGHALFAERVAPPRLERVNQFSVTRHLQDPSTIVLAVPILISDKTLKRQFRDVLAFFKQREIRKSDALFPLSKIKMIRLNVIEQALKVWHLRHHLAREDMHGGLSLPPKPKLSLYDIGERLNVSPKHKWRPGEPLEVRKRKMQVMKVAVCRATDRAFKLIANAEVGCFPSYKPTLVRTRWTQSQAAALERAVKDGKWVAPGLSQVDLDATRKALERLVSQIPFGLPD
jgi:hypothetical protein